MNVGSKFMDDGGVEKVFYVSCGGISGRVQYLCNLFSHVCNSLSSPSANIYKSFTLSLLAAHRRLKIFLECSEVSGQYQPSW